MANKQMILGKPVPEDFASNIRDLRIQICEHRDALLALIPKGTEPKLRTSPGVPEAFQIVSFVSESGAVLFVLIQAYYQKLDIKAFRDDELVSSHQLYPNLIIDVLAHQDSPLKAEDLLKVLVQFEPYLNRLLPQLL